MNNFDIYKDESEQENWVNLSEPVFSPTVKYESETINSHKPVQKAHKKVILPVLTFQLAVSLFFLMAIFLARSFLPELYFKVQKFYDEQMNRSMITEGDFSDINYENFFSSSRDEA